MIMLLLELVHTEESRKKKKERLKERRDKGEGQREGTDMDTKNEKKKEGETENGRVLEFVEAIELSFNIHYESNFNNIYCFCKN